MIILDGKKYRDELLEQYKEKIEKENLNITLAIIQVGSNEASNIYVKNKIKFCNKVGIKVDSRILSSEIKEEELLDIIEELNSDENITGIILQSPTPKHIDFDNCCESILPTKDVDGFGKDNIYSLYMNNENILPCTVKGIIKLLEHYNIELTGKNITIVGRGNIVGKPLQLALENRDATVTLCHSKTLQLEKHIKDADILISAVGKPNLINKDMVKENVVVVDVAINRVDGKICGDFNENVAEKASMITPVPGGIGPMTIAMIIDNLIEMKGKNKVKVKR